MVKTRLVACLLWREGQIVQSVGFRHTNVIGNAMTAVDFFNVWGIDEIVVLDVSRSPDHRADFAETIETLSEKCFVPLTVGGWIDSREEIRRLLQIGADKIAVNTAAMEDPEFITTASREFGSQCITVSIDAMRTGDGHEVYVDRGREPTGTDPAEWAYTVEKRGAGEVFLTSIDQDGSKEGYDIELVRSVAEAVTIPVVASGGVGEWHHLVEGVQDGHADAVSVANRFHHTQHSTRAAKEHMLEAGLDVREPAFADRFEV